MSRALRLGIALLALLAFGLLAVTLAGRVAYPWPLEWMEGSVLHQALRLVQGEPLYVPPAVDFVPYLYPPLGYVPMAAGIELWGATLPAARVPALLALMATLFLLGRAAARADGGAAAGSSGGAAAGWSGGGAGWLGASWFALGFAYTGAFYDLVRVDGIFLLLVAAGVERFAAGRERSGLAFLALSVLAKQHGVIFLGAASLWLLAARGRPALAAIACAWLGPFLVFALLHAATGGWSTRYVWVLPQAQGIAWGPLLAYLLWDLPLHLPVLALAAASALWRHRQQPRAVDALLLAGLAASALGLAHPGAFDNARIPGLALLAVVAPAELLRLLADEKRAGALRLAVAGAVLVQALGLAWRPAVFQPAPETGAGFEALVQAMERCARGGSSVALDHALLTGTPFLHMMEVNDLLLAENDPLSAEMAQAIARGLAAADAPAAVAVGASFDVVDRALAAHYRPCESVATPLFTTGFQPPRITIHARRRVPRSP